MKPTSAEFVKDVEIVTWAVRKMLTSPGFDNDFVMEAAGVDTMERGKVWELRDAITAVMEELVVDIPDAVSRVIAKS